MSLFKKNLTLELLAAALLSVTVCLFGPLEILLSQSIEFWFTVTDVLPIILAAFAGVFGVLMLIFFAVSKINERALKVAVSIVGALGFCTYIQGNWTFVNYGNMDGTPINWGSYSVWAVADTLIWAVLEAAVIYIINSKRNIAFICAYLFAGVMGIELITLTTLAVQSGGSDQGSSGFSLEGTGEFQLSADKKNVFVLVADGFDGTDFLPALEAEPELKDKFDGFTFYKDTCGTSLFSEESGINLLTGNQFEVGPSFADNVKQVYENTDLYDVLEENNYDTYIYCEEKMVSPEIIGQIKNASASRSEIGSTEDAFSGVYKMVAFRYMPHVLKKYFWYSSMDFAALKGGEKPLYYNYDVYSYLEENGISVSETDNNVYQFMWIQGPHEPANTDRYCRKVENTVQMDDADYANSQFEQTIGVVRLFTEIIDCLKDAGVYDNTTVIFTADHGWDIRPNPLLLIKPENSSGELAVSGAPVSMIEDYLPTLEYFLTGNDTGNTIYSLSDGESRERLIYEYSINTADRTYNWREEVYYPQGAFDTEMKFGTPLTSVQIKGLTVSGFSYAESSHIWTDGKESELKVDLPEGHKNIRWEINCSSYNGEQPVTVYANDTLLAEFTVNGAETRSFLIPADIINGNTLDIRLELLNAIAPHTVNPSEKDERELALRFQSMTFTDTDEEGMGEVTVQPTYKLGTELYFDSARCTAYRNCVSGFSYNEDRGAWTDGREAKMKFVLDDYSGTDLTLSVTYTTFNGAQRVRVTANGTDAGEFTANGDGTSSVTIPASCISDNTLELTFELPDAVSPADMGAGADPRILALYMETLTIS